MINGAPATFYYFSKLNYNTDTVWNMLNDALAKQYLIGVDTTSSTLFGLGASHAYTVMGAYPIKDTNNNVVARLIHVRNPWNIDSFSGPWSDGSSQWTDAYKKQVPYINNKNDGGFFIEVSDLVRAFYYF